MQTQLKIDLGLPPGLNFLAKKALGLRQIESVYERASKDSEAPFPPGSFCQRVLDELEVSFEFPTERILELLELHKKGTPLLFVANHPLGAIEALILMAVLSRISPDFKIIGNSILETIPELRPCLIPVSILDKVPDPRKNLAGMRAAVNHLKSGGVLGMFPAGQVSSFKSWGSKTVSDIEWTEHLGRIVRTSKTHVVSVFFEGRNSLLFQYMSLAVPELRVALLAREMLRYKKPVHFQIGKVLNYSLLSAQGKPAEITRFLRKNCEGLAFRKLGNSQGAQILNKEICELRRLGKRILKKENFEAFIFYQREAPNTVQELGRLREMSFRKVGEGTGLARDLDRFDSVYLHLVLWDDEKKALVGSYRMGLVDQIFPSQGAQGLYTSTLFEWDGDFLKSHLNSIELGRSFVVEEYQKNFWSLHLLWKALGQFISENSQYGYLFGPVSISGTLPTTTQSILVRFLKDNHTPPSQGLENTRPVVQAKKEINLPESSDQPKSLREAQKLIQAHVDPDFKIPPLIKHYSSLGGEILGYNVDSAFQDSIDCLFFLDLSRADPQTMKRYIKGLKTQSEANL